MIKIHRILLVITIALTSCNHSPVKAKYEQECDLLMAFYADLPEHDLEYMMDTYFVAGFDELDEETKQVYSDRMSYLSQLHLSNDSCKVESYGDYQIVRWGDLQLKVRKVEHTGFLVEAFVPLMKGDAVVGWV